MALEDVNGIMRDLNAEAVAYNKKWSEVIKAGEYHRRAEISRVCAKYELEPDEFYTAEQKAEQILTLKPHDRYAA